MKKEEIIKFIDNSKHFCILPWIHAYVTGIGNLAPCMSVIEGPHAKGYGSLNEYSFEDLWNGEVIREFRLKMLQDENISICTRCYERESIGYFSLRKEANELAKKYADWILNTDEKGYAPQAKPIFWDLRFSNLCNLRCRTCCYDASSSWYHDEKELGLISESNHGEGIIAGVHDTKKLLDSLEPYFKDLEKIHFAGGEPLLIDENYYIMQKLTELKKFDVHISYNTNLSELQHKNQDIMKIWKNFTNLTLFVSLDNIGDKCEFIRKGSKWSTLVSNIHTLRENCPNIDLRVNTTVSIFNIIDLCKIHRYFEEEKLFDLYNIRLNLLHVPIYYNIKILPQNIKDQITEEIYNHIEWLTKHDQTGHEEEYESIIDQFKVCASYLNSDDQTELIPEFINFSNTLDKIRNESLFDVFNNLSFLKDFKVK